MARYNGLNGNGFIVLAATDPSCNFIEIDTLEEAENYAGMRSAKGSEVVIIYAPIAIIRPKFDTAVTITTTATNLLKQLNSPKVKDSGE